MIIVRVAFCFDEWWIGGVEAMYQAYTHSLIQQIEIHLGITALSV